MEEERFPTSTPDVTLGRAIAFFRRVQAQGGTLRAIGIGSFGPVDPNPASPTFGHVTSTPKPGWAHTDVLGRFREAFPHLPVGFDTDVNAAALGEYYWGAARGLHTFIYLTIGTGIGGGIMANGSLVHGLLHPEMGHVRIPHDREADPFPGICPYHGDCFEGLASGPAVEARWGARGETLPADHPAWPLEARYIALGLVNFIVTLSPQRVIVGGGVMAQPRLMPLVRRDVLALLNGYICSPVVTEHVERYIVPPALGSRAGVLGAALLGMQAAGLLP